MALGLLHCTSCVPKPGPHPTSGQAGGQASASGSGYGIPEQLHPMCSTLEYD